MHLVKKFYSQKVTIPQLFQAEWLVYTSLCLTVEFLHVVQRVCLWLRTIMTKNICLFPTQQSHLFPPMEAFRVLLSLY
jgi:hypothetical protein